MELYRFAGTFHGLGYPFGQMNDIVYPVRGGMEVKSFLTI